MFITNAPFNPVAQKSLKPLKAPNYNPIKNASTAHNVVSPAATRAPKPRPPPARHSLSRDKPKKQEKKRTGLYNRPNRVKGKRSHEQRTSNVERVNLNRAGYVEIDARVRMHKNAWTSVASDREREREGETNKCGCDDRSRNRRGVWSVCWSVKKTKGPLAPRARCTRIMVAA